MRSFAVLLTICTLAGCGSKSSDKGPSAGVPLSIKSPEALNESADKDLNASVDNPAIVQLIQKAQTAAAEGRNAVAVEALSQAIGIDARNSQLFQMRADVYALMGENANARADFSLAIECDQQNAELYNIRGYFLMTRGAVNDAVKDFNKALELNPQFAAAFNNRGLVRLSKQEYKEAIADFEKAVDIDRKYADALNNRGFAYMKNGDLDAALVDLKATVKLKPDYTAAWNNCGLVYMQQEKYDDAIAAFSEAVRLAPFDVRWLNHRRGAYQKVERFEEANADARKIRWLAELNQLTQQTSVRPGDAEVWMARAEHLAQGAEHAAAVQDFSRALKIEPANIEALNGRAQAFLNAGEARKAIADCDVSLITQPSTTAFALRGDAWFSLKNYDQAIQDFEAGQKFDESVAEAYRQRAAVRKQNGEQELAQQDLKRASEIAAALNGQLEQKSAQRKPLPFPDDR